MDHALRDAEPSRALIDRLEGMIHEALGDLVTDAPPAIVDFPDIRNCGDSAIWLGEMAYLERRHGLRPAYVSRIRDFSPRRLQRAVPDGPIFIHGGGNFGDVWLGHQDFRERVLERFAGRRVIQFPQSIHYGSTERLEQTRRVIARHGDFVLLVRDEESRAFAEEHFDCTVRLCPDMAFCIGPLQPDAPQVPVLAMLREDKEKSGGGAPALPADIPVEDWITESAPAVRRAKVRGAAAAISEGTPAEARLRMLDEAAHHRFNRGIRQISRGEALVTDRLHVHICSLLIGRPHAVLDNSYGKIRRFMDAFSGSTDLAHRANGLDDAVAWARGRAGGAGVG